MLQDNDGNTPLMVAFIKKDKQITSMLLRHPEIDLKLLNKNGFNSLHFAAIIGNSLYVYFKQRLICLFSALSISSTLPEVSEFHVISLDTIYKMPARSGLSKCKKSEKALLKSHMRDNYFTSGLPLF